MHSQWVLANNHRTDVVVGYLAKPIAVKAGKSASVTLWWRSNGTDDCPPRDWADHGCVAFPLLYCMPANS